MRLLPGLTFVKVSVTGLQCDSELCQYVIRDVDNPICGFFQIHGLPRARSLITLGVLG